LFIGVPLQAKGTCRTSLYRHFRKKIKSAISSAPLDTTLLAGSQVIPNGTEVGGLFLKRLKFLAQHLGLHNCNYFVCMIYYN
jgi:hypothetical protein